MFLLWLSLLSVKEPIIIITVFVGVLPRLPVISDHSDSLLQKMILSTSVHLMRPVTEGAAITLSYFLLLGLSKEEQQNSPKKTMAIGWTKGCQATTPFDSVFGA